MHFLVMLWFDIHLQKILSFTGIRGVLWEGESFYLHFPALNFLVFFCFFKGHMLLIYAILANT